MPGQPGGPPPRSCHGDNRVRNRDCNRARSFLRLPTLQRVWGALTGHHSHQSGREADIGFFVVDVNDRPRRLDHFVAFDAEGNAKDGSGLRFDEYRNWLMIQMWLRDQRAVVGYVFVATHVRRRLLGFAKARPSFSKYAGRAAKLLLQLANSSAHDDHIHVRIACPERHEGVCFEHGHVND